jgi:hypothetical protein
MTKIERFAASNMIIIDYDNRIMNDDKQFARITFLFGNSSAN